jgi:hypothetical protein
MAAVGGGGRHRSGAEAAQSFHDGGGDVLGGGVPFRARGSAPTRLSVAGGVILRLPPALVGTRTRAKGLEPPRSSHPITRWRGGARPIKSRPCRRRRRADQ